MNQILVVDLPSGPYALAAGPDGAMWVTLVHSGQIARVTVEAGDVTVYTMPQTVGPRSSPRPGRLVFTRNGMTGSAGSPPTVCSARSNCSSGSAFRHRVGPGGALWFTAMNSGVIGRVDVDGTVTEVATPGGMPSMTAGPDALWFTLNEANAVG